MAPEADEQPIADPRLPAPLGFGVRGYEILEELGRGGMGIVYHARELSPAREVALKMMLPLQWPSQLLRERFRLEIQAAATLDHPNILPVYQTGEQDSLPFFTMKLARGGTLLQRIADYKGRYDSIATLMETISRAVAAAHERGILHRDLKPGNILFDEAGQPFVADFGLAKLTQAAEEESLDITRTASLLGTPHYMPPETLRDGLGTASVRSDVYALGAILYFLLSGQPPFSGRTLTQLLAAIDRDEVVPPRRVFPGIPRDLETICLKCLEKDPARRYASGLALAEDLRRFSEGKPTSARPVHPIERLWLWARRNPVAATMGTVISVLALALSIGAAHLVEVREERQRNQAAMTVIEERVKFSPRDPSARIEQGLVMEKAGRWGGAAEAFAEAVRLTSEPPLLWDFNDAGTNRDWKIIVNIKNASVSQGILRFTPLKTDASFELMAEPFEGKRYPWLHVRLRNGPPTQEASVFWLTEGDKTYSDLRHAKFFLVPQDTEKRIYSVDLGAIPDWSTKRIVGFRCNTVGTIPPGVTMSGEIELDWVCLNASSAVPVISLLEWKRYIDAPRRRQSLLHHSRIMERLGNQREAERDYALANRIEPREMDLPPTLINLTRYYNASLNDSFHDEGLYTGSELNEFSPGARALAGVTFDARGIIQVAGLHAPSRFPAGVTNIPVQQPFAKLHALMGAGWEEKHGREVATITLHYVDGHNSQLPIFYGIHVKDWTLTTPEDADSLPQAVVAWIGQNEFCRETGQRLRLYKTMWSNPRPTVPVRSLDFSSATTACAPFLLALTVEP